MFKLFLYLFIWFCIYTKTGASDAYIENFNDLNDISQWQEHSDTVQNVGKSKGSLVLLKTTTFQTAVLFTLLNPQPCGAAFAGVRKVVNLDLSPYRSIILKGRGQGSYNGYKFILHENKYNYSFCHFFQVSGDMNEIILNLKEFKPYYAGKIINDPKVHLDLTKITSIGIQAYGGVYLPIKQSGAASLEIAWIKKA
ncbi:hypothetical protein Zmor_014309 [Zophobas morio]|uniref:NADH:ubiquinone oxidoreductase intermediate-associated protein 30 domain-containing protein n=1 Tax=Zophobas morio TaxID=2755281 RepID=A0AA38IEI7_9CUCU|nr:hypothetical protein Zmor_014309 [Zophobas morio]